MAGTALCSLPVVACLAFYEKLCCGGLYKSYSYHPHLERKIVIETVRLANSSATSKTISTFQRLLGSLLLLDEN
jgi:hypothetical protein